MHRSRCTHVHLQTPRWCLCQKKMKRRREPERGDHPQLLPINSPPLLPLFFIPAGCLCPPSGSPEVLVPPRQRTAGGELKMRQYEETIGYWDLKHHENRDDCICPQKGTTTTLPPILWLDGCQATASISAWLQPCHLLSHTLDSIFSPIFCCSFSVPAFWTALSVFFFFLTDGKSRSQKKEQKLHWIADDSVEFPNSLPGQTRTPEKFGRIPVRSASQAQPFMKFSSRLNPASGNQLFSSCKYGSFV